jgi:hypothetical protein
MLQILQIIIGLASLVCFVMVVIKMFQSGDTGLGIACVVLIFCGIGGLIAFIMGWVKSAQYDIKNVMLAWTGLIVVGFLIGIVGVAMQAGG